MLHQVHRKEVTCFSHTCGLLLCKKFLRKSRQSIAGERQLYNTKIVSDNAIRLTTVTHSMLCASVGIVNTKSCIRKANSLQTISPHNTYIVQLRILLDMSKWNKYVLYDRYIYKIFITTFKYGQC